MTCSAQLLCFVSNHCKHCAHALPLNRLLLQKSGALPPALAATNGLNGVSWQRYDCHLSRESTAAGRKVPVPLAPTCAVSEGTISRLRMIYTSLAFLRKAEMYSPRVFAPGIMSHKHMGWFCQLGWIVQPNNSKTCLLEKTPSEGIRKASPYGNCMVLPSCNQLVSGHAKYLFAVEANVLIWCQ